MTGPPERLHHFTIHTSVAQRWWLRHLPMADLAARFLYERLLPGDAWVVALDTLEFDILDAIVKDISEDLDSGLAQTLATDVASALALMTAGGILRLAAHQLLLRAAMLIAAARKVSLVDALAITVAQESGSPLIVADRAAYARLQRVAAFERSLRVAWLADLL